MNMSLPKECQTALDRVNEIGGRIKSAKEANTDFAPLLEELTIAKAALNKVIRPIAEAEKEKGSTDYYWNVLAPVFEKVMTKGEKKKHDKENKNRKKRLLLVVVGIILLRQLLPTMVKKRYLKKK